MNHQQLIERSHRQAVEKGFWETPLTFDMAMALIISEIAEALEAFRKGRMNPDWNKPEEIKESWECEIADAMIRIYDWCGRNKLDVSAFPEHDVKFTENEGKNFMILFENVIGIYNDATQTWSLNYLLSSLYKYAEYHNINIERFILWKLDYNLSRPFKHGKQF